MNPQHRTGQAVFTRFIEVVGEIDGPFDGEARQRGVGAVEDQARQRHALLRQPLDEEGGLTQGVRFGGRNHDELSATPAQQFIGAVGLFPESAECGVQ
ncbi:Uncharacterised protein [Mycobacteroides abscessus subsp. abscessus]|nr:Uncharacterised protein [Mycobacteroides abscessus subsp. abscessus]